MANWSDLKAAVAQVIKTNGSQEITGQVLQNVLNSIISNVGGNATYAGIATPSTNPGAPDGNVFYFATQAGTYTNFGGAELEAGLNILLWNGSSWSTTNVMIISQELGDDENTVISQNALTNSLNEIGKDTGILRLNIEPKPISVTLTVNGGQNRYAKPLGIEAGESYKFTVQLSRVVDNNGVIVCMYKDYAKAISNDAYIIYNIKNTDNVSIDFITFNDYQYIGISSALNDGTQAIINVQKLNQYPTSEVGETLELPTTFTDGVYLDYLLDGSILEVDNSWFCVSDFIDVSNYKTIMFPFLASYSGAIYYDSNKNPIGKYHVQGNVDYINKVVIIPDGVYYIRWNLKKIYKKTKKLYVGSQGILSSLAERRDNLNNIISCSLRNLFNVSITDNKSLRLLNSVVTEIDNSNHIGHTDYIDISDCGILMLPFVYKYGGIYYDSNKNAIEEIYIGADEEYKVLECPDNAHYIQLNINTLTWYTYEYYAGTNGILKYLLTKKEDIKNIDKTALKIQPSKVENLYNKSTLVDNQYIWVNDIYVASEVQSNYHFRSDYIDIEGIKLLYTSKVTNGRSIIWYDENKELIGYDVIPSNNRDYIFVVPTNTKYCIINEQKPATSIDEDFLVCDAKFMLLSTTYNNYLGNNFIDKKIAWYGTSIPHGYPYQNSPLQNTFSYANRVAALLGAKIQNRCVSGGFIISKDNTDYQGGQTLRFTDLTSTINYQNSIIDLIDTDDEPDLFVFDWGANDGQFYQDYFDGLDMDSLDMSSEDTKTFLGAYNFIIKQTLMAKPDAKIILCTHYSDDGQSGEMTRNDGYKKMNDLIIRIAEYWHLPVNDVRSKTGWIYSRNGISNLRSIYCKDGIHPAASYNKNSIDILTSIHYNFIKSL